MKAIKFIFYSLLLIVLVSCSFSKNRQQEDKSNSITEISDTLKIDTLNVSFDSVSNGQSTMYFVNDTTCCGQGINFTTISPNDFPKGIEYEGKIKNAVDWTDKMGKNIVILTETAAYRDRNYEADDWSYKAELFAYHFVINGDSLSRIWRIYDFVPDCILDITAEFVENTFNITDLNNDGYAEIWLMYRVDCLGGADPVTTKIIMYEGQQKYAIRGVSKVAIGTKEFTGGEYKCSQSFVEGPKVFLDYALCLWNKNIIYYY